MLVDIGEDKAHVGRSTGTGLVHCVFVNDRTLKARCPHVGPSAAPGLDRPTATFGGGFTVAFSWLMSTLH
jgi:hypothetical protein